MRYEQKQISCFESFQDAIDQCCTVQVNCVKQLAKATCEVWSTMLACYVSGVTKGLEGVRKCCDVRDTHCDERTKGAKCGYHEYCMTSEAGDMIRAKAAQLEFDSTFETRVTELGNKKGIDTLAKFYEELGLEAEKLGEKKTREAKTECYRKLQSVAEELGHEKGIEGIAKFYKDLEAKAKEISDRMKK